MDIAIKKKVNLKYDERNKYKKSISIDRDVYDKLLNLKLATNRSMGELASTILRESLREVKVSGVQYEYNGQEIETNKA